MANFTDDLLDKISGGCGNYAASVDDDPQMLQAAGFLIRDLKAELTAVVKPEDECKLVFASVVIRPDLRVECLVIVLGDRLVIIWKAGRIFRKTVTAVVIPLVSIKAVEVTTGDAQGLPGAVLMHISGDPAATIALPTDRADAAAAVISTAIGPVGS